jgi:hypothetical protein
MEKNELKIGQKVFFGRPNGEKTLGTVVKVNRKKCKIRQEEQRGQYKDHRIGSVWTVPFSLIFPVDEGRPSHVTRKPKRRPCLVNILTGKRTYGSPGESEDSLYGRMANGLME